MAYKLMDNLDITSRIKELRGKLENKQLWSREQSINVAKDAIQLAREKERPSDMLKGVEVLNRIFGYNESDKVELSMKASELSEEQLEALARARGLDV
jgi:hypothetical protein